MTDKKKATKKPVAKAKRTKPNNPLVLCGSAVVKVGMGDKSEKINVDFLNVDLAWLRNYVAESIEKKDQQGWEITRLISKAALRDGEHLFKTQKQVETNLVSGEMLALYLAISDALGLDTLMSYFKDSVATKKS